MTPTLAQQRALLLLLVAVSAAFAWIVWPFFGAVFWAAVLALLFTPPYRRLVRWMGGRRSLAATTTLLLCLVVVILPTAIIAAALVQEVSLVYQDVQSKKLDVAAFAQQLIDSLPAWMAGLLERLGVGDVASMQAKLAAAAAQGSRFMATQVVGFGVNTFDFLVSTGVMLYLLFFFLRDGGSLAARIERAIPLSHEHKAHLFSQFATVVRATIKGNLLVAAVQGALGGVMLWMLGVQAALLGGVLMALFSLLPAVGAALVWAPVAVWFLLAGSIGKGLILIVFGLFAIGLVDNILRPILVGKDTQMPDYLVLVSTLGGIAVFGLNGFVIGPAIAALFLAAWDLYSSRQRPAG
ncbi:MAG TPA: AI-2E family transporter [Albitalea sp.]|nr:AI-2E family transporter [Albitalea sp.]